MKPYKCPICNGTGIVSGGFYLSTNGYSTSSSTSEVCQQCQGSGIIWGVEDYNHNVLVSNTFWGKRCMITVYDMDSAEKIVRALILNGYVVTIKAVKKSFPNGSISHFEVQIETGEAPKDGKGD